MSTCADIGSFIGSKTSVEQTSNVGFTSEVSDYRVVHTGPDLDQCPSCLHFGRTNHNCTRWYTSADRETRKFSPSLITWCQQRLSLWLRATQSEIASHLRVHSITVKDVRGDVTSCPVAAVELSTEPGCRRRKVEAEMDNKRCQ